MGRLALIQPVWHATRVWRERALSLSLLAFASTIVIAALGVAFFQQSARAAEADVVCAQVRSRIDSVLGSGRSGLWDWDIARGRIFVSDSFYALLGRERADDFLSFADIRDWVHPDDEAPFGGADAGPGDGSIDREFRMLHADGRWIWIRVRGRLTTDQPAHLVGIAVDITDEKAEAEVRATADVRLRDAIESISEAFALFDDQETLVLANSRYQRLLALPTASHAARDAPVAAAAEERWSSHRARAHAQRMRGHGQPQLRNPPSRRPLVPGQRARHQGRRPCVRQLRHHGPQSVRGVACGQQHRAGTDRRGSGALARRAAAPGDPAGGTRRKPTSRRRRKPKAPTAPRPSSLPT